MTTTRELRAVLREVEPGFKGVEIAAIHAQAKRIRTRRRVAGAVVGSVAVVSAAVSIPHLPFHPPQRSLEAAMPAGSSEDRTASTLPMASSTPGPFRPRTGPLPKVTSVGPKLKLGVGDYRVWLRPSRDGKPGELCHGSGAMSMRCEPLARGESGLAGAIGITTGEHDGPVLVMVAEAPIKQAIASSWGRVVQPTIGDLGQGYVAVVALMPRQPKTAATLDQQVLMYDDNHRLVAVVGLPKSADVPVDSGVPAEAIAAGQRRYPVVKDPRKVVTVGLNGEKVWMAPPTDDRGVPVVCLLEKQPAAESCADVTASGTSVLYTLGLSADPGMDVELAITDAKVTRATATLDGRSVEAGIVDLGSGYLALRAVFQVGYGSDRSIELRGFDVRNKEVVRSAVGVRLTK